LMDEKKPDSSRALFETGLTEEERKTYDRLREKVTRTLNSKVPPKYQKVVEVLLFLPDFVVLIFRLMKDSRVPARAKAKLALFAAYLASPVDIIPDFIPVAGQLDDLVGAVYVIRNIMKSTPREVILEHWSGQADILEAVHKVLDVAGEVLGSGILAKVMKHFK